MRRTLRAPGLALLFVTGVACTGTPMTGPMDMRPGPKDMRAGGGDGPPPDLFKPDLAPATIDPKPTCGATTPTATDVYTVVQAKCSGGGACHLGAGMAGGLALGANATQMRAALVNVDANFGGYKRVKPSDVDNSLLIYKLTDQGTKIPGGGGKMPQGDMLSDAQLCTFYNWVKNGAN